MILELTIRLENASLRDSESLLAIPKMKMLGWLKDRPHDVNLVKIFIDASDIEHGEISILEKDANGHWWDKSPNID